MTRFTADLAGDLGSEAPLAVLGLEVAVLARAEPEAGPLAFLADMPDFMASAATSFRAAAAMP